MRKYFLILLTLIGNFFDCTSIKAAEKIDEEIRNEEYSPVQRYSNSYPNTLLIKDMVAPDKCYFKSSTGNKWMSFESTAEFFIKALNDKNYDNIWLDSGFLDDDPEDIGVINLLFQHKGEEKQEILFFSLVEKDISSLIGRVHQSVLQQEKWDYPEKIFYWEGETEKLGILSWNYIDCAIHYQTNFDYEGMDFFNEYKERNKLFNTIKKLNLENSTKRFLVLVNTESKKLSIYLGTDSIDKERYKKEYLDIIKDI